MSSHDIKSAERPAPDAALVAIADYAQSFKVTSAQAYETARYCLMDTLACGFQALAYLEPRMSWTQYRPPSTSAR
jgi:2-methylcitrate dehydratase